MVKICGIGESQVAEEIQDLIEKQTNPTIAPYAKTGEVHLRITAKAEDEKKCKEMIKPIVHELKKRFGKNVFATKEEKTLEEAVRRPSQREKYDLISCRILHRRSRAARIVNVPGASEALMCGFVTYTNRAKRKCLGVKKSTLKNEGAVSAKCAKRWQKAVQKQLKLTSAFLLQVLPVLAAEQKRHR